MEIFNITVSINPKPLSPKLKDLLLRRALREAVLDRAASFAFNDGFRFKDLTEAHARDYLTKAIESLNYGDCVSLSAE